MKLKATAPIIIGFIITIFSCFIAIAAIDTPHNASNNISCGSCHGAALLNSPFWGGSYSPVNIDDTVYNKLCLNCHRASSGPYTDTNAPLVKTHSSLNTSNKYGNWTRECRNCHDPHYQKQKNYKNTDASNLYLATGTITSCVYNGNGTSTLTYSTITYKSGWDATKLTEKTGDYRRTILFPNVGKLGYNYPIIAVDTPTAGTITVTGNATAYLYPPTTFAAMYGQYIKDIMDISADGSGVNKTVKFFDQAGTKSFADGDTTYNGVCEVCHTQTTHFRNDGGGSDPHHTNVGGADGTNCITCHSHVNGFRHGGGGGTGCIECHGHDAGYEYETGKFSQGKGTYKSHSTHTENDSDDLKGPNIACGNCHNTNSFPFFRSKADPNAKLTLVQTDVCNDCHSPGGTYDGVNAPVFGAKANWVSGAYESDSVTLKAGKEKWCATCHDEAPSVIQTVSAPNVVGDEDGAYTYGTGWGYYKTGHGLAAAETYPSKGGVLTLSGRPVNCDSCHDFSTKHIDGLSRTFDDGGSSTLDPSYYRQGYRLKMVPAGQGTGASTQEPMLMPWPKPTVNSANNYRLCVNCHDSGPFLDSGNMNTNLVTDGINRHEYHMAFSYQLRYSSDWDNAAGCNGSSSGSCNSQLTCVACHNVHGSTRLAMVRDGKLEGREPGLQIWYNNSAIVNPTNPPGPQNLPLSASTGTIWIPGSSGNICSHCHGGGSASIQDRTPYQNVQQAPTLAWTGENGYTNDGVNPDSGPSGSNFTFRVKYTDTNNNAPTTYQVWVDTNDNGVYDAGEKFNMNAVDSVDTNYYDGKLYTYTMPLSKAGDNTFTYRFKFSDGTADATGDPASDHTVTVTNNAPVLSWTGEAYYANSGVNPVTGGNNANFTFRIKYTDQDNECPSSIQVWIDANDNGSYEENEKHTMTAADANACSSGRIYTYSTTLAYAGNGDLLYTFRASDGFAQASGDAGPLSNNVVTVLSSSNIPPLLEWVDGACRTEGVSPRTGAADTDFTFLVKYTDLNNSCPASGSSNIQVWIDENDNGIYEESEKYNLTEVDAGDTDCTNGKLYKTTRQLAYADDGNLTYRFYASDGSTVALGDPADSDSTVTVVTGARKVRPTGGSGWYSTIQSAVSASQTILVYPNADFTPATYNESVGVNGASNVTIRSVCGPDYTIVHGSGQGWAIRGYSTSSNLAVDGFSLTGDTNGVYANGDSPVTVSNCKIYGNTGVGVLANSSASLTITNCEIFSNASSSVEYGGGIYLNSGTHTIENSTIRNNSSQKGAGVYATSASLTITGATIKDNTATGNGGGVFYNAGTLNMSKSTVSGNTSSSLGGGFYLNTSPTTNLENCLLVNNRGAAGGMAYVNSGTTTIKNCTIADNQATSGNGGAIYTNNVPVTVRNSIFWNNIAFGSGHNLYKVGDPDTNNSTITDSDIITGRYYIDNCTPTFANNIALDPFFAGSGNYHLQSNSPAIDTANAAYAPADDRDGNARPQGSGYDMGAYEYGSGPSETEAPVVTGFTATTPSTNRNVPITLFTATDNVGVTGYRITTSSIPPSAGEGGWSATAPSTYLVTSDGTYELYPWAKDAAGNVSAVFGTPRTVVVDATAPIVTAFTATTPSLSYSIPITSFTATDVVGVTGYQITTSATAPAAGGGGWSGTAPTTYTVSSDGTYTLYPWAKDAIGNVSALFAIPRTVVVDTTPPTVSSTNPANGAPDVTANSPVTINWSENIDCTTVNTTNITMSAGGWSLTSCSNSQAVFATGSQSGSTTYTVTVRTSVKDANGNPMALNYPFSYTTSAVSNTAPALSWASASCLTEGVRPRTGAIGADYEFRVIYSDADNQCPTSIQVTVNGSPYDLTSNDGASCQTARTYYRTVTIATAGDLNYSFAASDGIDPATGVPTTNHTVSVINTTYKVRPTSGSGWYTDLPTAYNATPASGTLLVYPNADFTAHTYTGALSDINKTNRTLQSVCGADLTIINGNAGTTINLQGNDGAVIDGFSITGGTTYGIYDNTNSMTVKNSKIYSNPTGIYLNGACNPVSVQNSKIYSNTSYGINVNTTSLLSVADSEIYNNGGGSTNGPGITINGGAGITHSIVRSSFTGNTTTGNGGAIYMNNGAISIDDSTFQNNSAASGGGICLSNAATATITDTFIQGNSVTGSGGGITVKNATGTANLTNVMLTGNKASTNGGAIYEVGASNCLFCTISGNYAGGLGGGIYQTSTASTVKNSIVYNNYDVDANTYEQIYSTTSTSMTVYYTLINQAAGSPGYTNGGGNNTSGNPNFVSPLNPASAPTTGGDYHLQSGSPAVNAGSSSYPSDHDIFGGPRPLGSGYDMGAHEKE